MSTHAVTFTQKMLSTINKIKSVTDFLTSLWIKLLIITVSERKKEKKTGRFSGSSKATGNLNHLFKPLFLSCKKHFCIFLFPITGQCALWLFSGTDFTVSWQTNSEAIS